MVRCGLRFLVLAGAACAVMGASGARAAETLATTLPSIVTSHAAAFAGRVAADQMMHLAISLPLRDEAGLHAFLDDLYDPASPNYRHYLSVAAFTERFGPTAADYQGAVDFFTQQGLTVTKTSANRMLIDIDAKVADVERVFHVQMGYYRRPGAPLLFMSADRQPTLDLATPVQEVIGLDDFVKPTPKNLRRAAASHSRGGSGPGGQFTGTDMHTAYYPAGMLTGAGQSVGLMELEGINLADVQAFFAAGYGPHNHVKLVRIPTDKMAVGCGADCDDTEQALDVEYTISLAPGLSSVRIYVGSVPEDVLNAMASDDLSKVLSTSWGWNERFATDNALFLEFAAQGQTNLTASGDYSSLAASGPWPEEDAFIVAVGGTDVEMTGNGQAWSGEKGWNGSAGGPTLDTRIKIRGYQQPYVTTANGASSTLRNVPDIAANADTDMQICADGGCDGGWGGTSFASPIWAGYVALANQYAAEHGLPPVGFINPILYRLGHNKAYDKLFHDETTGRSGLYSATPSYDMVTGLGSPQGGSLLQQLTR